MVSYAWRMQGLIIGAGQLGSRYIQGLTLLADLKAIWVVEPDSFAMKRAHSRFLEMPDHAQIQFRPAALSALADHQESFDFGIIATPALHRLEQLQAMINLGIKTILCEKVTFQSVDLCKRASVLAAHAGAHVHVPYIMRYIPLYRDLRARLIGHNEPILLRINAGNVGLGCNLIHYLDCFEYITSQTIERIHTTIDLPLEKNKRGNDYIEFSGRVEAFTTRGDRFALNFDKDSQDYPVIHMESGLANIIVHEAQDSWLDLPSQKEYPLHFPRMSDLTATLIKDMMAGTSPLPQLHETESTQCLMLESLNHALHQQHHDTLLCPIT